MQCCYVYPSMRHKKCLQTHHHVSPPTFGVDILLLLLYSNIYKGIRSFVLVPWMQRQCPVVDLNNYVPSVAIILVTPCHRKPEAAWLREIFTNFLFVFMSSCRRNRKSYFCLEGHFDWNFSGSKLDFAVSYL